MHPKLFPRATPASPPRPVCFLFAASICFFLRLPTAVTSATPFCFRPQPLCLSFQTFNKRPPLLSLALLQSPHPASPRKSPVSQARPPTPPHTPRPCHGCHPVLFHFCILASLSFLVLFYNPTFTNHTNHALSVVPVSTSTSKTTPLNFQLHTVRTRIFTCTYALCVFYSRRHYSRFRACIMIRGYTFYYTIH